jgi:rRNA maturation endonuclease Nob1
MSHCSGCYKRHDPRDCPHKGYSSNICHVCGGPQLGVHYHESNEEE